MRQWVTTMGAQTLKATFKSLHATLGMWASTCWRNIRLRAAAWEVCGRFPSPPPPPPPPHQFNYIGSCRSFRLSLSMKRLKCSCCCRLNMSEVLWETFSRPAYWYLHRLELIWENAALVHTHWANWTWNHPSDVWNRADKRCYPFIPHSVHFMFCHFVFCFTNPPGVILSPQSTPVKWTSIPLVQHFQHTVILQSGSDQLYSEAEVSEKPWTCALPSFCDSCNKVCWPHRQNSRISASQHRRGFLFLP